MEKNGVNNPSEKKPRSSQRNFARKSITNIYRIQRVITIPEEIQDPKFGLTYKTRCSIKDWIYFVVWVDFFFFSPKRKIPEHHLGHPKEDESLNLGPFGSGCRVP